MGRETLKMSAIYYCHYLQFNNTMHSNEFVQYCWTWKGHTITMPFTVVLLLRGQTLSGLHSHFSLKLKAHILLYELRNLWFNISFKPQQVNSINLTFGLRQKKSLVPAEEHFRAAGFFPFTWHWQYLMINWRTQKFIYIIYLVLKPIQGRIFHSTVERDSERKKKNLKSKTWRGHQQCGIIQ